MSKIPKHDCKQKGESDNSEQSRINLSVSRNTISIDNFLKIITKTTIFIIFLVNLETWKGLVKSFNPKFVGGVEPFEGSLCN